MSEYERDEILEELIMYYEAAGFEYEILEEQFSSMSTDELIALYNEMIEE